VASCASRKAVERSAVRLIDSIRYEVRYVDSVRYQTVRRDSVYLRDSIVVQIDSTGRTTDRWHVVYKYVADNTLLESYRAKIDSMASMRRRDSIVTKIITKEPTKFQKFRMDAFWIMSGLIMILLFFLVKRFS
jgi:hypothetical protein